MHARYTNSLMALFVMTAVVGAALAGAQDRRGRHRAYGLVRIQRGCRAGNTIAVPRGKTFTISHKASIELVDGGSPFPGEPIRQVFLFCTRSAVAPDAPGVVRLTVADRQQP
jgi:hypothetical protein